MDSPYLAPLGHAATSEELRLRAVARTNGENLPASQEAVRRLHGLEMRRRMKDARRIGDHRGHPPDGSL